MLIDSSTKKILWKIAIDVSILTILITITLLLFFHGTPFKRGFFCNDESLMHPYQDSTVSTSYLVVIAYGLPMTLILITEVMRFKLSVEDNRNVILFSRDVPIAALNVYKYFGVFLFAFVVTVLTTDIGKHVLGRFRPHFMKVCDPIMVDGTNCSNPINAHRYIEEFTCGNQKSSANMLKQMRLSFPSGHSSIAMFSMVFAVLYIQHKMTWNGSALLKHLLQFLLIAAAWFTALSRISDYKHHWSDVLGGSLLGILSAVIAVYVFSDIAEKKKLEPHLPTLHSSTTQF